MYQFKEFEIKHIVSFISSSFTRHNSVSRKLTLWTRDPLPPSELPNGFAHNLRSSRKIPGLFLFDNNKGAAEGYLYYHSVKDDFL